MKRPTVASLKKVTAENLVGLGAERLAEILVAAAAARPELKRRLRMELAAEQGAEHLLVEIDKRLVTLSTSRSKITWRQRPGFIRDLDALRALIVDRLAPLETLAGLDRLLTFLDLAPRIGARLRDRDGELAGLFARTAQDVGGLLCDVDIARAALILVEALTRHPSAWTDWAPAAFAQTPPALAGQVLRLISQRPDASPAWMPLIRQLADVADDIDAYRATYTAQAMRAPHTAAAVASRLLSAGRTAEAGAVLQAAVHPKPASGLLRRATPPADADPDWERAQIAFLDQSGEAEAAQAARWRAVERDLSLDHAKAYVARLPDFEDVEAESRIFDLAARHADMEAGLTLLIAWPALREAAEMIAARSSDIEEAYAQAEAWAGQLRARYPAAAETLLRRAAAAAFRRRDFKTSDRLTEAADAGSV